MTAAATASELPKTISTIIAAALTAAATAIEAAKVAKIKSVNWVEIRSIQSTF